MCWSPPGFDLRGSEAFASAPPLRNGDASFLEHDLIRKPASTFRGHAGSFLMSLKGKTIFITGASRGIGLAIALRAARDGANIAIAAKTAEPHPKLKGTIFTAANEVRAAGGKALPVICDIRDEAQVIAAVDKSVAE